MDWESVRDDFPMVRHQIEFNSAAQASPGQYWLDAMRECLDFHERGATDSTRSEPATHPYLTTTFRNCREKSAELIGADVREVTTMYRPMLATNLIADALFDWAPGDNLVFTDLSYPSQSYVFLGLRDRYGIELRRVENVDGEIQIDDLREAVDDDTKLVCINRTTCWCGFTYDVSEVTRIAHEHGAYVLDDAMQAVGALDIDVHNDDLDFLVTGSYKWQCGPEGAGVLFVRGELLEELDPAVRNYVFAERSDGFPFSREDHDNVRDWERPLVGNANRFNHGACTTPVLFGWDATLDYLLDIGLDNIESRVRELGDYLVKRLQDIGCTVVTPHDPTKRHGLIVYTTGDHDLDEASYERFASPQAGRKPIDVTHRFLGGVGGIRVSTHFYNTSDEIEELVERQAKFMAEL